MSFLQLLPSLRERTYLVLASGSPRRKEILGQLDLPTSPLPTDVEETMDFAEREGMRADSAERYVVQLAERKLAAAVDRLRLALADSTADEEALLVLKTGKKLLVIAADTVVVGPNRRILEKPVSDEQALEYLRELSGQTHNVLTGVAVQLLDKAVGSELQTEFSLSFLDSTAVVFRELSEPTMEAYVQTGEPNDKAGGYGIQGLGGMLVQEIRGCFWNVVGFPLSRMGQELVEAGLGEALERA